MKTKWKEEDGGKEGRGGRGGSRKAENRKTKKKRRKEQKYGKTRSGRKMGIRRRSTAIRRKRGE